MTRPDATDLFKALEAGLCEGTPTLTLRNGHIWIDGETSFDARSVITHLLALAKPGAEGPEGWRLVPAVPTTPMRQRGAQVLRVAFPPNGSWDFADHVWESMIAAAPPPPSGDEGNSSSGASVQAGPDGPTEAQHSAGCNPRIPALSCVVCGREMDGCSVPNQPLDGLAFYTRGAYGTTVFDPMDGSYIELNLCDPCLLTAGQRGQVLHYAGSGAPSRWNPPAENDASSPSEASADNPAPDEPKSSPPPPQQKEGER